MYPTEFIAKFLGIIFVVFAIAILIRPAQFKTAFNEIITNPAHLLFASFINLFGGTLLVLFHSAWVWSWALLVTVICWIIFIRAIAMFLMPEKMMPYATKIIENPQHIRVVAIVHLVLGVILLVIGFMG